jgi:hypothetical protein
VDVARCGLRFTSVRDLPVREQLIDKLVGELEILERQDRAPEFGERKGLEDHRIHLRVLDETADVFDLRAKLRKLVEVGTNVPPVLALQGAW